LLEVAEAVLATEAEAVMLVKVVMAVVEEVLRQEAVGQRINQNLKIMQINPDHQEALLDFSYKELMQEMVHLGHLAGTSLVEAEMVGTEEVLLIANTKGLGVDLVIIIHPIVHLQF
jgi:uncharacterized membrane protein